MHRRTRLALGSIAAILVALLAIPAADARVRFRRPVRVSKNAAQSAAEPSIRAARDGRLYIVAPTGLVGARVREEGRGGDLVWRSRGRGRRWRFLGQISPAGGGDSDIAPDRSGDLWASGLTLVNTTAAVSTDHGETWHANPIGSLDTVVDRQWVETYRDRRFAFLTTGRIRDERIILTRLHRGPDNTPIPTKTVAVSGANERYQWPGEIAVDNRRKRVYVAYNTIGRGRGQRHDRIVVARTNLQLERRRRLLVDVTRGDSFDSFVAVDEDTAGNLYVVWTERRPRGPRGRRGHTNTYLAIGRHGGRRWSAPIKLNHRARTTTFPWVVAGARGRVAVAYYGTRATGRSPEQVTTKSERPAHWKVWVAYSRHARRGGKSFRMLTATRRAVHEGDICTSGTGCAAGTRDLLDFFQLDINRCGRLVIAYTNNRRDVVRKGGRRTRNRPELVTFVGQRTGARFLRQLDPAC